MTNAKNQAPAVPLPQIWPDFVKSALLHVISLAQFAAAHTRGCATDSINARVRLRAENDRLQEEVSLLREEIHIKDARMARIDPYRRPQYPLTERMAILELKAARSWSLEQTAQKFLVTAIRPTASRATSRATAGRGARPAQGRGRWCGAKRARDWK